VVTNPTLGIFCDEASSVGTGALIKDVQPGSAAERGGLRVNDVLIEIAGIRILNQVDFAKAMMLQEVGKAIEVKVRRDAVIVVLTVVVGNGVTKLVPSP
jgi:serine protease Do